MKQEPQPLSQTNPWRSTRVLRGLLLVLMVLAVPALALSELSAGKFESFRPNDGRTAIASSDDMVANGFQILEAPAPTVTTTVAPTSRDEGDEVVLKRWYYTSKKPKPKPSPGK